MTQRYAQHYPESFRDGVDALEAGLWVSTNLAQSIGVNPSVETLWDSHTSYLFVASHMCWMKKVHGSRSARVRRGHGPLELLWCPVAQRTTEPV